MKLQAAVECWTAVQNLALMCNFWLMHVRQLPQKRVASEALNGTKVLPHSRPLKPDTDCIKHHDPEVGPAVLFHRYTEQH